MADKMTSSTPSTDYSKLDNVQHFYQLRCVCTTPSLNSDSSIVSVMGLPSYMANVHMISDDQWYGQFGQIVFVNIDINNNCANIKYSMAESANNARKWTNSPDARTLLHQLITKNTTSKETKETTETKQNDNDNDKEETLQIKYDKLLQKFTDMKNKEMEFENREKQFEQQVKQFQYQIAEFAATKQQSEQTTFAISMVNTNLQEQINKHNIQCNLLNERLKKLDTKYAHVFRQLVNRITQIELVNSNNNIDKQSKQRKPFSIWSTDTELEYDKLHKMNKKYIECKRLMYELNETYDDLCD
eukprot:1010493_1